MTAGCAAENGTLRPREPNCALLLSWGGQTACRSAAVARHAPTRVETPPPGHWRSGAGYPVPQPPLGGVRRSSSARHRAIISCASRIARLLEVDSTPVTASPTYGHTIYLPVKDNPGRLLGGWEEVWTVTQLRFA